jgi:hypothetical protein
MPGRRIVAVNKSPDCMTLQQKTPPPTTSDPRLSVVLQTGHQCRWGADVIRPTPTIIARLAFLYFLAGQGQLHAYHYRFMRLVCLD